MFINYLCFFFVIRGGTLSRDLRDYRIKYRGIRTKRNAPEEPYNGENDFAVRVDPESSDVKLLYDYQGRELTNEEALERIRSLFKHKDVEDAINEVAQALIKDKSRHKRSTIDNFDSHMSSIMGAIEDKLHGLEVSEL